MPEITTFLMFEGAAEEAMTFYVDLFADAEVLQIARRRGPNQPHQCSADRG